ncbi:uncharacterized protein PFLUO_LOCUS4116 [Penicillium psychrofluorescens]|uniref:uncharacterized protein n=1 Tax=Penicillium psychrofluorescens TaxID=3158075 RepID=UPI003CCD9929
MGDYGQYNQGLYLSPNEQDLLLAALSSNNPAHDAPGGTAHVKTEHDTSPDHGSSHSVSGPPSGGFDDAFPHSNTFGMADDESPYLDFNPEVDFEFPDSASLIGDLPGTTGGLGDYELGEKRKSIDSQSETNGEDTGNKRRESEAKKPGRKPLTSEPTTKRKAQNRAAQRAFRERKERHLKDLETKVDDLQKSSDSANQENGVLRAQIERLQVELREYRKRLSWATNSSGISAMSAIPSAQSKGGPGLQNSEFLFDFPKFGDLPGRRIFNKNEQSNVSDGLPPAPGVLSRGSLSSPTNVSPTKSNVSPRTQGPNGSSPAGAVGRSGPVGSNGASNNMAQMTRSTIKPFAQDTSTSDSPSSSSDSHQSQLLSSSGTSPEPSVNSPRESKPQDATHKDDCGCGKTSPSDGEKSFCAQLGLACGNINNPIPAAREHTMQTPNDSGNTVGSMDGSTDESSGIDWLTQQNGGQFDPVLFGDWREPQDAILSQDFGTFFNDAFPLPDLGSPSHNITEATNEPTQKKDLLSLIDDKLNEDEVVPGEDKSKMLSCNKIWDRLQSMEKFRNGEIDVDNLCSELRTKARCSEGGVVVNQNDVDAIMGRAK